jgi:hypothetical protein
VFLGYESNQILFWIASMAQSVVNRLSQYPHRSHHLTPVIPSFVSALMPAVPGVIPLDAQVV